MRRTVVSMMVVALALAGCVTAHIDYSLGGVRPVQRGRYRSLHVALELKDSRFADKKSVATYAHREGTYNAGVSFPASLSDYGVVFGGAGRARTPSDVSWYTAPDRLYWVPSGPMEDLRARLAEHLRKAAVFGSVEIRAGSSATSRATLRVELKRFVSLKERRKNIDTFGFLGVSALASSREIVAVEADWRLADASGRSLDSGTVKFVIDDDGSCWRAKNKPFELNNRAAKALGDALAKQLD